MFTRSSKPIITQEQREKAEIMENQFWREHFENAEKLNSLLLDSSLITPSLFENYDMKIVKCGNYIQVYKYQEIREKKKKGVEKEKEKSRVVQDIIRLDIDNLKKIEKEEKKKKEDKKIKLKKIEEKNIYRSRFQLQRIVKSNEDIFKTFITLTFANFEKIKIGKKELFYWLCPNVEINFNFIICKVNNYLSIFDKFDFNKKIENYTSIKKANEKFDNWRSNLKKRLKNDFKYVCVPEFQKNGTVHYHLLTNIDYTDFDLLSKDELKIYKPKTRKWQIFRTMLSWKYGYSSAINIKNINIVGYISKYMTKDIDNRLFGHRRYLCSRDLLKPSVIYMNSNDVKDNSRLNNILNFNYDECFKRVYADLNGLAIDFVEYKQYENLDIKEVLENGIN